MTGDGRLVAEWATRGNGSGVQLWCHYEGTDSVPGVPMSGNIPAYHTAEWSRGKGGLTGEHVFGRLNDADAIAYVQEIIDSGRYTMTGAKNPPARV